VNSARAALTDAAAELGAEELKMIAEHPKQWGLRGDIHGARLTVNVESKFAHGVKGGCETVARNAGILRRYCEQGA